jgi:hypothetical protein
VRIGELLRAIDGYTGRGATAYALKVAPLLFVRPGELRHAETRALSVPIDSQPGEADERQHGECRASPPRLHQ